MELLGGGLGVGVRVAMQERGPTNQVCSSWLLNDIKVYCYLNCTLI